MESILSDSPARLLREVFETRRRRNPAYSLRSLARDLKVSHSYLSLVLREKRKLPVRRAVQFGQMANLTSSQTERLVRSVQAARWELPVASAPTDKAGAKFIQLELDRFRGLAEWHHLAILDLTLTEGFKSDPKWIAKRLGLRARKVSTALNRLRRLGLLEKEKGHYRKVHSHLSVPTEAADEAIRRFHEGMIEKALISLKEARPEDFGRRDFSGSVIPVDPKRLKSAETKIEKFRKSLIRYLSKGKPTELYQLNVQIFPLTKPVRRKP